MTNIGTLNKISQAGLGRFSDRYAISEADERSEAIIVRSADMHGMAFGDDLKIIARAGVGVNNIPLDECAEKGIVVVNAPGANANGVKELVICSMIMTYRNVVEGVSWANSLKGTDDVPGQVEKGKSQFKGKEILGKTVAVIGLGGIGSMVANALCDLGMYVTGYDKFFNDAMAGRLRSGITVADSMADAVRGCDFLTVHLHATEETRHMIDGGVLEVAADGAVLLNFSRAAIVDDDAVKAALESGKLSKYVTDFPSQELSNVDNVVMIPHLGASTAEAEDNCAMIAADEVIEYLENGNIINSVNFPSLNMGPKDGNRLCVLARKNEDLDVLISEAVPETKNMSIRSNDRYSYALAETDRDISDISIDDPSVIKIRKL